MELQQLMSGGEGGVVGMVSGQSGQLLLYRVFRSPPPRYRSYAGFVSGDQLVSHAIQMRGIAGCEVLPVTGTVVFSQRQVLC